MTNIPFRSARIVNHDPRSLEYKVPLEPEIKTVLWEHKAPVLNQLLSSACTGMSFTQILNTDVYEPLRIKITGSSGYLDEQFAYSLYAKATQIDEFVGEFPEVDSGSSGLAVCKVAHRSEWISEYQTAIGWEEFKKAIQTGPVYTGSFWTTALNMPDDQGFAAPLGTELGGHQYAVIGLDVENEFVTILNSYGTGYGDNGRMRMKFNYFSELLHNLGDAMIIKP